MNKLLGALGCVTLSLVLIFGTTGCPAKEKAKNKAAGKEKAGMTAKEKGVTAEKEKVGAEKEKVVAKEKGVTAEKEKMGEKEKGHEKEKGTAEKEKASAEKEKATLEKEKASAKEKGVSAEKEKATPEKEKAKEKAPTKEKAKEKASLDTPDVLHFYVLLNERCFAPVYAIRSIEAQYIFQRRGRGDAADLRLGRCVHSKRFGRPLAEDSVSVYSGMSGRAVAPTTTLKGWYS